MNQDIIKAFITEIVAEFERNIKELPSIPNRHRQDSDFFLTELLMLSAAKGSEFPRPPLKATALALEYLDQAVKLGYLLQVGGSFCDGVLLATDFFYAEAINQVASLGDVEVIVILASAIEATAAERTKTAIKVSREYLIDAAIKLGFHLSQADSRYGVYADNLGRNLMKMTKKELFEVVNGWRV